MPNDWFLRSSVGRKLADISVPPVPDDAPPVMCEDFQVLSSYNWVDLDTPTIIVPGAPPKWTPLPLPVVLPPDRGVYYCDQNRHRNPRFPLESLFRSIYTMNPAFDPKSVDLFTDRANLRKLIVAVGEISKRPIRIEVEMVGDTLLFTRCEEVSTWTVDGRHGFGHEFEEKFTTYDNALQDSTGHHRVVQYILAGLKLVVRFEVDGYQDDERAPRNETEMDKLTASLESLQMKKESKTMNVVRGGYDVPQESLLELKTRVKHNPLKLGNIPYQLWFGQVPWLVVGYHENGEFTQIDKTRVQEIREFQNFETNRKVQLMKVIGVIDKIRMEMKRACKRSGIVLFQNSGIQLYEMRANYGNSRALPEDLLKKWD